jgi:L-threonylcarbamoyladenylate synthase
VSAIHDLAGDGRDAAVAAAVAALRAGELVVAPTDTVYAVLADAFDLDATAKLRRLRGTSATSPLTVLLRSPKQLAGLVTEVPLAAERLMAAYWPGPLTLILPDAGAMQWDLGRTDRTVAVRMPLDDVAIELAKAVGPIAFSAAGRAGDPPPVAVAEAQQVLGDEVVCYLDAGPRTDRAVSTVVDLTRVEPEVLRVGLLPAEPVLAVATGRLDPLDAMDWDAAPAPEADDARVPESDEAQAAEADEAPAPEPDGAPAREPDTTAGGERADEG